MNKLDIPSEEILEFMQTPGYHLNGVRTVLVDMDDQHETLDELKGKVEQRVSGRAMCLVGIVSPTDDELEDWADIHLEHSVLRLDNDRENIADRIFNDSVVAVFAIETARGPEGIYESFTSSKRLQQKRTAYAAIPEETWERAREHSRTMGGGRASRSSESARWTATLDYKGSLGGGSPRNPLRVNTSKK